MSQIPNPGSPEALDQGCQCPVSDNHHGQGMPYPSGLAWWISAECPLHTPQLKRDRGSSQR